MKLNKIMLSKKNGNFKRTVIKHNPQKKKLIPLRHRIGSAKPVNISSISVAEVSYPFQTWHRASLVLGFSLMQITSKPIKRTLKLKL